MRTVSTQMSVSIPVAAWRSFDRYTDFESYPHWDPSTRSVRVTEIGEDRRLKRAHFDWERSILGIPLLRLSYSLRCEIHASQGDTWFVKFDDAQGDLRHVITIVEFRAVGEEETLMTYKSVVADPYLLKRTLAWCFGPSELSRHLHAFRDFAVESALSAATPSPSLRF